MDAGHGKITLLVIPHFAHQVYRIQVSPFLLAFFLSIFLILIGFFGFSIFNSSQIESKKDVLATNKSHDDILIQRFITNFENIANDLNRIMPKLEETHFIINEVPRDLRKIEKMEIMYAKEYRKSKNGDHYILDQSSRESTKKILKSSLSFDSGSIHVSSLSYKLEFILRNFNAIHSFVRSVEDVLYNIPSSWPVTGGFITSLWGIRYNPFNEQRDMHWGIDVAHAAGIPIRATAPGVVVASTFSGRYGNVVNIRHKYGYYTVYAHNHVNRVKVGQKVYRGQVIAEVGQTGYATGPHCHYSIMVGKENVNPYSYLLIH